MIPLNKIIEVINPIKIIGNTSRNINLPKQLDEHNTNDEAIMWVSSKFIDRLKNINRGVIISQEVTEENIHSNCTYLVVENPRSSFRLLLSTFFAPKEFQGISDTSIIDDTAVIGTNIFIGENVVIEPNCMIGDNSSIGHNSVIKSNTQIGVNVKIGSNNVIGGVGFGYEKDESGKFVVIPHIGNVVIEDMVEIGNCTTVDRAVMGSTYLRKNCKIDNLVHIAHGVDVGENSLVIANAMVAGSVTIGKNVWIAPSSSILNGITIDDDAVIGVGAVALKSVGRKEVIVGNPGKLLKKLK